MALSMNLLDRDKTLIWHPFTQHKIAPEVIGISRGQGSYLYDPQGKAYLDLISSWWVNLHGHGHPEMAESIYEQAKMLEHVVFAGFTHEPAVQLCEDLKNILPMHLCRFFFSDNGSTAVEIALKMAYQYWWNIGYREKKIFLSFDGGYHGDTFGAMAVGAKSGFHAPFQDFFFDVLSVPYPDTWDNDADIELKERNALRILRNYLDQYSHRIAAIVLEPLIQGASGMRLARPCFIRAVMALMRQNNILVVFDEVMTGFCRTGTYFALDQLVGKENTMPSPVSGPLSDCVSSPLFDCVPDFLCLSKGLTGGFLPLALTVTTSKIYEAFLGDDFKKAFAHGHSYTANPLACRAAITSLKILQSTACQQAINDIAQAHQAGLNLLKRRCPGIYKTRTLGTIAAFDLEPVENHCRKENGPVLKKQVEIVKKVIDMAVIKARFLEQGLLLRPLGSTIYLLPPYCITPVQLEKAYDTMAEILNNL